MFVQRSIWHGGLMTARPGARRHLAYTFGYNTICGVNTVSMRPLYRATIWMSYPPGMVGQPGRDRFEALEKISLADAIFAFVTCKDCRAKVAAEALLSEDEGLLDKA